MSPAVAIAAAIAISSVGFMSLDDAPSFHKEEEFVRRAERQSSHVRRRRVRVGGRSQSAPGSRARQNRRSPALRVSFEGKIGVVYLLI